MNKEQLLAAALKKIMLERGDWLEQASCRGLHEDFDLDEGDRAATREKLVRLRKICADCPVFEQCLRDTLMFSDEYTFRAGMTATERKKLMRKTGELSWDKKQEILRGYAPKKRDFE